MAERQDSGLAGRGALAGLQAALADRALLDQAIGVLAERFGVTIADAVTTLFGHARSTGRGPVQTARAVVDGEVPPLRKVSRHDGVMTALRTVCALAGLDATGAEVVRHVGNVVFRMRHDPVIVKVMPTPALAHRAAIAVAAARLFEQCGVPAIKLWSGPPQPIVVNGFAVTLWREERTADRPASVRELAALLIRLHGQSVSGVNLPVWNPFPDIRRRIHAADHTDESDLDFLTDRCDELEEGVASLGHHLPTGLLHGDAHLGNVLVGPDGPLWCDLDGVGVGPLEWDLVPTAVGKIRFGDRDVHDRLADAYGFDVTEWPGFPVFRGIRELKLVVSVLPNLRAAPAVRSEFQLRMRSMRTGDETTMWSRYR